MEKRTSVRIWTLLLSVLLVGCAGPAPRPIPTWPPPSDPNLDAETLALMDQADRVVFVVPFSHWDTDWHEAFPDYVKRSDGNILAALQMARETPRFRYALEQVLFVQHFWDTFPEHRAALTEAVRARQLTFAWAGLVQPETSLAAPAVQWRNLQMGQDWIAATFGPEYVPRSAWQSDAFGNSAAFPQFLGQAGVPFLFIGRSQFRCPPEASDCQPLPHAFYWRSPASPAAAPVLVSYLSYPTAWDAIHRLETEAEQLQALRAVIEVEFARTTSKYVFLPMGSDFIDPLPNLPELVALWNAADAETVLVMADPDTAFQYLATQPLPDRTVDLNPIWQGFYASRPFAKIADKESEYFLTAGDKFGLLAGAPESSAWYTAAMSAHYDNIGAVSFDWVWEGTQRPRYQATLAAAAHDLASSLAQITSRVPAPLVVFNPTSWPRSGVIELSTPERLPHPGDLPAEVQVLGPDSVAVRLGVVPPVGYAAASSPPAPAENPATAVEASGKLTLSNGLVSVTMDAARGGTFSDLSGGAGPSLVAADGDEIVFFEDTGDIYGARFGAVVARESQVPARLSVLAAGPLLARAQAVFMLVDQAITKTVTLRADEPTVEVTLELRALPDTSAVLQTPTTLRPAARSDDLGFLAFTHAIDDRPIVAGDVTYRRQIFYPFMYWSSVSSGGQGLTLLTHGLQGLGGMSTLNLLLVRQVTDEDGEGVTDQHQHRLRYAYLPRGGAPQDMQLWQAAYEFNQPLLAAWRNGDQVVVQVPFAGGPEVLAPAGPTAPLPLSYSLVEATGGLIADVYRRNARVEALILTNDPESQVRVTASGQERVIAGPSPLSLPLPLDVP
jgi:hypothetical protein